MQGGDSRDEGGTTRTKRETAGAKCFERRAEKFGVYLNQEKSTFSKKNTCPRARQVMHLLPVLPSPVTLDSCLGTPMRPFIKYIRSEGGRGYPKKRTRTYKGKGSLQRTYVRPYNFQTLITWNES